jgi:hypothetical protein
MRKINYIQSGILLVTLSLAGCAANNAGNNPLATADSSLAAVGGAAQSGQQILNSGVAIANPAATQQIGLVDILVRQLGVSPQQAMGGAGAIFQVAQGNMNPQAFNSLSQSVPGMSTMLGAAPAMPAAGGLTSLMGNSGSSLGSVAALTGSFQQLNLSPNMVSQFIPVVTSYVRQTGGQATADLLQSALGVR